MLNNMKFKTVLIIGLGFFMASVIAPIFIAIFQTHYEIWVNDKSLPSEKLSQPISTETSAEVKLLEVILWLDAPGKTQFQVNDKVTLYYQVTGKEIFPAYFTLFNVADKWSVILRNEAVKMGKLYSLPKGAEVLQAGQNVGTDARLRLTTGRKYFRAVVTPEPVQWEMKDIAVDLESVTILGEGTLIIEVN